MFRYLSLLHNQKKFAFVKDSANHVLSLPPLTNCEETKMSASSKNILIEISSTSSMEICKNVMEQLFIEMFNSGIVSQDNLADVADKLNDMNVSNENQTEERANSESETPNQLRHVLIIQQVKIVDSKGALKTVYPSRLDLSFNSSNKFQVKRLYDESSN